MKLDKDKLFETIVTDQLKSVFSNGMRQGAKAICGVVLEEIQKTDKTDAEKLMTLTDFCKRSLGVLEKDGDAKSEV